MLDVRMYCYEATTDIAKFFTAGSIWGDFCYETFINYNVAISYTDAILL